MKHWVCFAAVLLMLTGCSRAPAPDPGTREADTKSLQAAEEAAIKAFESRDAEQMAAAYSPEATLMLPNASALRGEDLKAALKELVADPNFTMRFKTTKVEAAKSGEIGYTRGAGAAGASGLLMSSMILQLPSGRLE
jgi:hypothetical protein